MNAAERALVALLRLGGLLTGLAVFAVFLPADWMAATHEWLGLGVYPVAPITDYLARSLSAFYAAHGALLFVVASDVRRFRPLVLYCGGFGLVVGTLVLGIDLHADLPLWWTLVEGPWIVAIGGLILALARHIEQPAA
jgi:hypothetical protein